MGVGINSLDNFGKIVIVDDMFSSRIIDPLLKIISGLISILLVCAVIAIVQPVHAATVTGTVTQTQTGTPGTPSLTNTPSPSLSETPTSTLLPLPAITLIFPESTSTSTATRTPRPIIVTQTPNPPEGVEITQLSPRIRILAILLIILWLFLTGFVILYIRQFR